MYLGMDVGTSGVKAVLVNEIGAVVATASCGLTLSHPAPLFSEQDPDAWVDAAIAAVDSLAASHPGEMAAVRGIGLSGQMHGATLLDADDRPLRPAILWNDGRSAPSAPSSSARCRTLARDHRQHRDAGLHRAEAAVGAQPRAGGLRATSRKVLLPKDYVRLPLTGETVGHVGCGRHALARRRQRALVATTMLAATGLDRDADAAARRRQPADRRAARRARRSAGAWRRRRGRRRRAATTPPARSGSASVAPGDAFLSLGTSGVLFVANAAFRADSGARPCTPSATPARHLAPDGRDALGRGVARLAGAASLGSDRSRAARAARRGRRSGRARCCSCRISPASARRTTTPPRAAPSSACAARPTRAIWPRRARRRRLRLRRRPRRAARAPAPRSREVVAVGGGSRSRALGADPRQRARHRRSHRAEDGDVGAGARRRAARPARRHRRATRRPSARAVRAGSRARCRALRADCRLRTTSYATLPKALSRPQGGLARERTQRVSSTATSPDLRTAARRRPDPLAFRWYDPDRIVLGKRMEDQLRFAVCYWHRFCWPGGDPFGGETFLRPWHRTAPIRWQPRACQGRRRLRVVPPARRAVLHLPRPRHRAGRRDAAPSPTPTLRPHRASCFAQQDGDDRRAAAVGHRQPVLPPRATWPARRPIPIRRSSPTPPRR